MYILNKLIQSNFLILIHMQIIRPYTNSILNQCPHPIIIRRIIHQKTSTVVINIILSIYHHISIIIHVIRNLC